MLSRSEIDRTAAAIHNLRPDWPTKSLATFIGTDMASMAYTDVTTALTIVAVDPKTQTPRRVLEAGPWWAAVQSAFGGGSHGTSVPGPSSRRCTVEGHETELARPYCRSCIADAQVAAEIAREEAGIEPEPTLAWSPEQAAINARGAADARARLKAALRGDHPAPDIEIDRKSAAAGERGE